MQSADCGIVYVGHLTEPEIVETPLNGESPNPIKNAVHRASCHADVIFVPLYESQAFFRTSLLSHFIATRPHMMAVPRRPKFASHPTPLQRALIRELLEDDDLTVSGWAKAAGLSEGALRKIVTQDGAGCTMTTFAKLARARGKTVAELGGAALKDAIVLAGRVGAGNQVHIFGDGEAGEYIPVPAGFGGNPYDYAALEIEGDSMHPLKEGWRIIYRKTHDGVTAEELGKLCVIKIVDGGYLLKEIQPGTKPGFYNLESWNAPTLRDQRIEWASPVASIVPR